MGEKDNINEVNDMQEISGDIVAMGMVRLNALQRVIEYLEWNTKLRMNAEGLPYIEAEREGVELFFAYIPLDVEGSQTFLLNISATVAQLEDDIDDTDDLLRADIMLDCMNFNVSSDFGYTVFMPEFRSVQMRYQNIEDGPMMSDSAYETMINMFLQSMEAFCDSVEE